MANPYWYLKDKASRVVPVRYLLTIQTSDTDQQAGLRRLRAMLKAIWRCWRIKAVAVVPEVTPAVKEGEANA